jgi:predicted ferric reductase
MAIILPGIIVYRVHKWVRLLMLLLYSILHNAIYEQNHQEGIF